MIISQETAQKHIDQGKSTIDDGTTTNDLGERYYILTNHKHARVDHVLQVDGEPELIHRPRQGDSMDESTFYFKGDLAKYTGKTQELYGETWFEAEIQEGHREGELILTPVQSNKPY